MHDFSKCPRCGSNTDRTRAFSGSWSEFWLECTECNTFINTYKPQPHQAAVHKENRRYVGNFGGYGTGKTTTSRHEVEKHILITPNGNTLIGANVQSQFDQTIRREFEADFPAAFVRDNNAQKQYIDFINGHRVMYRPFDDPDKLRSYNLSMFVIVEASECKAEVYHQLKTRLRNLAATVPKVDKEGNVVMRRAKNGVEVPVIEQDWRQGIIESNPDAGWVYEDVLSNAWDVVRHGRVYDEYKVEEENRDPSIAVHIASTDVNAYLPENFIAELTKNKPKWWISRFIYSSFTYAEGMVYPAAAKTFVQSHAIPKDTMRLVSHDYGLSDDAVLLLAAVDEKRGKLIIYDEVRTANQSVEELSGMFLTAMKDIPHGMMYTQPLIDPKSGVKRDYDKKTLIDHYEEYGLYFKPGHINLEARIMRLNTYFETDRIEIFEDKCPALCRELRGYKYPDRKLGDRKNHYKPVDKNNHGINALEWICMELPSNPSNLRHGAFDRFGRRIRDVTPEENDYKQKAMQFAAFALEEEPEYDYGVINQGF